MPFFRRKYTQTHLESDIFVVFIRSVFTWSISSIIALSVNHGVADFSSGKTLFRKQTWSQSINTKMLSSLRFTTVCSLYDEFDDCLSRRHGRENRQYTVRLRAESDSRADWLNIRERRGIPLAGRRPFGIGPGDRLFPHHTLVQCVVSSFSLLLIDDSGTKFLSRTTL